MRALRWIGIAGGSLLGLALVALGALYALTQPRIGKQYDVPGHEVAAIWMYLQTVPAKAYGGR